MQWIVHVFMVHGFHQEAYRSNHDHSIAGFDGYDHIVEVLTFADAQKLHATFYDTCGSVAIARHDAIAERTMVYSYAYGSMVLFTDIEERH